MGLGGTWNNDAYGSGGSFYGPGVSAWNQNPSAYSYGFDWVLGDAADLTLGPNDSWTSDMRHSGIMRIDRDRMIEALKAYCADADAHLLNASVTVPLGRELNDISPWAFPFIFAKDLVVNPTAAFVGSWSGGTMTATQINCCFRNAQLHIHAINVSGTASATHGPPKNGIYAQTSLWPDNVLGKDGPMHSVTQTFDWDEPLAF